MDWFESAAMMRDDLKCKARLLYAEANIFLTILLNCSPSSYTIRLRSFKFYGLVERRKEVDNEISPRRVFFRLQSK